MKLFIIRHAARQDSEDNPGWRHAHPTRTYDTPLSARGIRQAYRLGERLKGAGISWIDASPFMRAVQTATIVNVHLNVNIYLEPRMAEHLREKWFDEQPTFDARMLESHYPKVYLRPEDDEMEMPTWPESHKAVIHRVREYHQEHTGQKGQPMGNRLVIGHGVSVRRLIQVANDFDQKISMPKVCALAELEGDPAKPMTLNYQNDISHWGE